MLFHFPGRDNLKSSDNSKSPKNELLSFTMQQERCLLDETMSGEAMTRNIVNEGNNKLKFLYRKNNRLLPICLMLQNPGTNKETSRLYLDLSSNAQYNPYKNSIKT